MVRPMKLRPGHSRDSWEVNSATTDAAEGSQRGTGGLPKVDRYVIRQLAAALVFAQTHAVAGAAVGFVSVFIIQESAAARLTRGEITWVVSALPIGLVAGNLISTALTPRLGYRRLVLGTAPFHVASWITMALSYQFVPLLTARVVSGLTLGMTDGPVRAYIGETSCETLRGSLGMLPHLCITINMLIVYGISSQAPWRLAVAVCGIVPAVAQMAGLLFLPEAAKWLLAHGCPPEQARRSVLFFRGSAETADKEVEAITHSMRGDLASHAPVLSRLAALLTESHHRRPFLLLLFQLLLFVFSAGEALSNFTAVIFAAAQPQQNAYHSAIWVGLARLVGFLLSAWLIERVGRIRLLQAAAALQMVGSLMVGFFFHYRSPLGGHEWLVMSGAVVVYFAYGIGIAPVTWVLFSELPATVVRSVCLNVLLVCFGLMMFSFVHAYVALEQAVGTDGVFWLLGGLNIVQIIFAQLCLPETQGLSLEQIQARYFERRQTSKDDSREARIQKGAGSAPSDSQLAESDPSDLQMAESDPSDLQMAESDPSNLQMAESDPSDLQLAESDPSDLQLAESDPSDLQLAESNPSDLQLAELGPSESQLAGSGPSDLQPSWSDPPDPLLARSDLLNLQLAESGHSEPPCAGSGPSVHRQVPSFHPTVKV